MLRLVVVGGNWRWLLKPMVVGGGQWWLVSRKVVSGVGGDHCAQWWLLRLNELCAGVDGG